MLVAAPGVVGDRPRTPDEPRRRLHLFGAIQQISATRSGVYLRAKLGVVREHRAAGEHSPLGRDHALAIEGETLGRRAVAARRGVVGDGRPAASSQATR